jgi:hypothetical protein
MSVLYIRCNDDLTDKLDRIVATRRKAIRGTKLSRSDVARVFLHAAADRELKKIRRARTKKS